MAENSPVVENGTTAVEDLNLANLDINGQNGDTQSSEEQGPGGRRTYIPPHARRSGGGPAPGPGPTPTVAEAHSSPAIGSGGGGLANSAWAK